MAIADDFSIALNGDIRYTGTTANYTVLELHRFLQDNADNASAATTDDLINITSSDPSSRATNAIITLLGAYNIDDTAAEHLYAGSVRQGSGATETLFSGLAVVGTVEAGTNLQIVQNDALLTNYWSTGINGSGNTIMRIMVKSRDAGRDIDARQIRVQAREYGDTYAEFSVTLGEGESTAAIFTSSDLNNDTAQGTVGAYDKHDNTEGYQLLDISGDGTDESYYSQWEITGTGTLPATPTAKTLYEWTKNITRRGTTTNIHGVNGELFRGITHSIVYDAETNGPFVENQWLVWGTTMAFDNEASGPFSLGEKLTFGTSGAVGTLLKIQDDAGATGEMVVAIEPGTGTVVDNEQITGGTSGATADVDGATRLVDTAAVGGEGLILALDDDGTTGTIYIQLVKGSAPVDNLPIHGHARTVDATSRPEALVNVTVSPRTVNPTSFFGTFTGSAFIGTYGSGIKPSDGAAADLFFPLDSATYPSGVNPPNNVTFNVNGLVSGEDRVLVAEDLAGAFNIAQLSNNALLNGAAVGSVVVTEAIPSDTPASGTIRVVNDEGRHIRLAYSSWDTSTFTLSSTYDFSGTGDNDSVAATNDVYITYIDKLAGAATESFNTVYSSDRTLRARVRDGGGTPIKEATGTGTLGTNGGDININRISDE